MSQSQENGHPINVYISVQHFSPSSINIQIPRVTWGKVEPKEPVNYQQT